MASMTISGEPNQSSSSPRSNRICIAAIARLRAPKPSQSSLARDLADAPRRKMLRPMKTAIPIGRLMKKT